MNRAQILSNKQQEDLSEEKIDYKIASEKYIRNHPELSDLVRYLFNELVITKPQTKQDVLGYIFQFFEQPDLRVRVLQYAQQRESDLTDYNDMTSEH
ncbi:MAG: hypothetical protein EZS28_003435 [Streblomastix strix]|uniref:RIIa domain-containing protein n=1 Tax=Streblomastix strix TaxID=222440 RepID=A0A5J4X2R5_9EUKA|nr:MAG: hypothetical protein EZS28_003435 [Streblomastix strix]